MTPIYDEQRHPLSRRILHWVMALSILVMIGSGWRIYNASPDLRFHLPRLGDTRWRRRSLAGAPRRPWRRLGDRVALRRHVDTGRCLSAVRPLGHRDRTFLARLPAGQPTLRHARLRRRAAVPARASAGRIQRRAEGVRTGASLAVGGNDDPVRHRDLEAGAELSAGAAVRRIPGRATGAFPRDGRHRVCFCVVHVDAYRAGADALCVAMVVGRATELRHTSHRRTHDDVRRDGAGCCGAGCRSVP